MRKIALFIVVFFTLTPCLAQVEWGINAGPIITKVIYLYKSGNPGSQIGKLNQRTGFHGGIFVDKPFNLFKVGVESSVILNALGYDRPELSDSKFKIVYLSFNPKFSFIPLAQLEFEFAPTLNLKLKNEYFHEKCNPMYFAYQIKASYQYNAYSIGIGYLKSLTPFATADIGSVWDLHFRSIELNLRIRLGQFNPKKSKGFIN